MPILATPLTNPFLWKKVAIEVGGALAAYVVDQLLEKGHATAGVSSVEWRRLQMQFSRSVPSGYTEDRAVITFDFLNITSGDVDNTWITSDYTSLETALDTFWTSIKPYVSTEHSLVEYRWFRQRFNDVDNPKPFAPAGPPQRVTARAVPGTSAAAVPYQIATSVTERTAIPKHWGRFYVPGTGAPTNLAGSGRFTSSILTGFANATQTLYNSAVSSVGAYPVVPMTQLDKAPIRALLAVNEIAVDDIPDVIRRRRPKQVSARQVRNT